MKKTNFPVWQQVLIYVSIFIGLKNIIGVIFQLILTPFMPSLLNSLQSPNYTFSPAIYASSITQILGFVAAVIIAANFIRLIFSITNILSFSVAVTAIYLLYVSIPTLRYLFLSQTVRDYLFMSGKFFSLNIIGYNFVLFFIFFLGTMYFIKKK